MTNSTAVGASDVSPGDDSPGTLLSSAERRKSLALLQQSTGFLGSPRTRPYAVEGDEDLGNGSPELDAGPLPGSVDTNGSLPGVMRRSLTSSFSANTELLVQPSSVMLNSYLSESAPSNHFLLRVRRQARKKGMQIRESGWETRMTPSCPTSAKKQGNSSETWVQPVVSQTAIIEAEEPVDLPQIDDRDESAEEPREQTNDPATASSGGMSAKGLRRALTCGALGRLGANDSTKSSPHPGWSAGDPEPWSVYPGANHENSESDWWASPDASCSSPGVPLRRIVGDPAPPTGSPADLLTSSPLMTKRAWGSMPDIFEGSNLSTGMTTSVDSEFSQETSVSASNVLPPLAGPEGVARPLAPDSLTPGGNSFKNHRQHAGGGYTKNLIRSSTGGAVNFSMRQRSRTIVFPPTVVSAVSGIVEKVMPRTMTRMMTKSSTSLTRSFSRSLTSSSSNASEDYHDDRWRERRKKWQKLINGPAFTWAITLVVLFHCAWLAVETDVDIGEKATIACGGCFTGIYLIELICRYVASSDKQGVRRPFLHSGWNVLDIFLVGLSVADLMVSVLHSAASGLSVGIFFRCLRVARLARLVRIFRFFKPLWLLACGITASMRTVVWAWLLIGLMIYIYALLFTRIFEPWRETDLDLNRYFGNVSRSMFSVFQLITLEGWNEIAEIAMEREPWVLVFFLLLLASCTFGLMHVIVAVFVECAVEASSVRSMDLAKKAGKEYEETCKQLCQVFRTADKNNDGSLSKMEFVEVLREPELMKQLVAIGIDKGSAASLFDILDLDGSASLDGAEFVEGMLRSRGPAQNKDVIGMRCDVWRVQLSVECEIERAHNFIEERVKETMKRIEDLREGAIPVLHRAASLLQAENAAPRRPSAKPRVSGAERTFTPVDRFDAPPLGPHESSPCDGEAGQVTLTPGFIPSPPPENS